jgi:hypothetical protein
LGRDAQDLPDVYVTPQIGMIPKLVWGCPRFGMSPHIDMGIPIPIWGPYFECRSNLVTIKVAPQIGMIPKPVWVSD